MTSSLDRFAAFRAITSARIGLGRAGDSLPTEALLDLREAHARARDAISHRANFDELQARLAALDPVLVRSRAPDRRSYLLRPDWGRRLEDADRQRLAALARPCQVVLVVADGLSASAIDARAAELVLALRQELAGLSWAPLVLVEQGRVAIGDEIAETLGAESVIVVLGERPGLSVADSLGIYLTHRPRIGTSDAERNCISNVHAAGASVADAAAEVGALLREARRIGSSGVALKLERGAARLGSPR